MAVTLQERKLLLDGEWIETGEWHEVRSPYSGEPIGRVPQATAEHARRAVEAAAGVLGEPLPAHRRAEILDGVAALLRERHDEVARTISAEAGKPMKAARVEDERVRLITFTGSAEVGWKIRERAARKKVNLELGNATPVIVEADADVEQAAAKLAANAFSFAGQSCISVQRIYVQRAVYEDFVASFVPKVEALKVGDPAEEETDVGPVIDEGARDRILSWIEEAKAAGASVLTGGGGADGP